MIHSKKVIYENGMLSKILTDEGYITLSGSTPTYHYYLKDHLGNKRVVMAQSGTVEQIETDMILSGRQKCKRPTQAVLSRSEIN